MLNMLIWNISTTKKGHALKKAQDYIKKYKRQFWLMDFAVKMKSNDLD